jgi:pyruvate formate lyase activating enzyme
MKDNDKSLKGWVFNIQRYSIHDGPGIRTTVFLKGCPLRCFWCQNPESQNIYPEILLFKDKCTRCGMCVSACQNGANSLSSVSAEIERDRCTGCGKCVEACPNEARTLVGKSLAVEEVVKEVKKDTSFYNKSGGGVTLSGGDPAAQPDFSLAILKECKEAGMHTAIETTGNAPWKTLEKILEYTDFVLFDIKQMDSEKHYQGTGRPNALILENARKVSKLKPMKVRVPLIPGFNDSEGDIRKTAHFVKEELGKVPLEILAYNQLGEAKYDRLGKAGPHFEIQTDEYVSRLRSIIDAEMSKA